MIALVDGDILVYRIGFACQQEADKVYVARTLRSFIVDMLLNLDGVEEYEVFISGDSKDNFRHDYAVTREYKGNRKGGKPKWYDYIRDLLVTQYDTTVSVNEEADDVIAIRATQLGKDNCIICSIDKDFHQIAGLHYNLVKQEVIEITPEQAKMNFYSQFLEGDRIDNIEGVMGIGKYKASQLLDGKDEDEMFQVCVDKLGSRERAIENGRLLYLRRQPNEIWSPPDE